MASEAAYTEENIRLFKWTFMIRRVAPKPLRLILQRETHAKDDQESLWDFFEKKNKKFKKNLTASDKDTLKRSTNAEELDITLLYKVIRNGSSRLANGDDNDKWKGDSNIESLITKVKNIRNEVAHEEPQYSEQKFKNQTEVLRTLLTDLLKCVEVTYSINTDQVVGEINDELNKYRDNDVVHEDLALFRFEKHCKRVREGGKENIKDQYRKMDETVVDTVNPVVDLNTPVDDIFSEMELEKSQNQSEKISYQRILEGICYTNADPIILLEGDPGIGKTTLVKKVLSEWMNETNSVVGLGIFSLVLHHEFRNEVTKDFNTLLKERMPDIAKSLKDDELRKAALHEKPLIILDGLDERNKASTLLFNEVLRLKRTHGITVMITSRPEQLSYLKSKLKALNIKLKHISLLGIPLDHIEAFVERYHKKMTEGDISKQGVDTPDVENLKKYLEETKHRLRNIWRLPYNLTFLTILYIERVIDLDQITTGPELYRQIFLLYRTKLKERLRDYPETKHLQDSKLDYIIDLFLYALAKGSIGGLMKNQINLQNEAYKRLEEVCIYINVPAEQMIGVFLKRVPSTSSQKVYGYPHKGIQDYLSAQYVWMLLSGEYHCAEIHKAIRAVFDAVSEQTLSPHISHKLMRVLEEEIKRQKQRPFTGKSHTFDAVSIIKDNENVLAMNNVPQKKIEKISKCLEEILQETESSSSPESANEKPTRKRKYSKISSSEIEGENLQITSVAVANQSSIQESTIISDILQDIYTECYPSQTSQQQSVVTHGSASKSAGTSDNMSGFEINKFQNVLLCLLGMFYTEGKKVQDEIKLEALKLLQETGVKDREAWLNVLSNVKCDPFIASFIASQEDILEGEIKIDDACLFPYLSLMKSLENPPENAKNVRLQLDIKQFSEGKDFLSEIKRVHYEVIKVSITDVNVDAYLTVLQELKGVLSSNHEISISIKKVSSNVLALLQQVNHLNLEVSQLELETHFRNPSLCDLQWQTQINQIMKRCPLEEYTGSVSPEISFNKELRFLRVSVGNEDSFNTLHGFLQSITLHRLDVCVSADSDHLVMKALPSPEAILPSLYIVDLRTDNMQNAARITSSCQPVTGEKKFRAIYFPRCEIDPQHQLDLIDSFKGMGIYARYLRFPSSNEPKQQQLIKEEAKKKLGCFVYWEDRFNDW